MVHKLSRLLALAAAILLAVLFLTTLQPGTAHAAAPGPLQTLPTWLEEALRSLIVALVKTLQDSARTGGVFLWGLLKLCGLVGLFGQEFSTLFGAVITEALEAVISGSLHDLIRGSLMVSLGLFGLSLLARPFWPDLKLVSFRRAALWGIVIQAYLLNAPGIYTELETWRVTLAEEVAAAVSADAIPGCSGSVVEQLLCITGASPAEVFDPSLTALPDGLPYGGGESVRDLYDHCVYNPPVLYGDPACDPEEPVDDPWAVLAYAQDALGAQLLGLVIALLILAYGVLQIALGLAAGMMFVLFPAAALFAFYPPLESFPAGVVRNYVAIFLKSVVLLTLAAVVIRLFAVAVGGPGGGSLAAMAAVALVDLLLCLVMAKEALASLLGSISFVGSSVSALGAAVGLTGSGGGAAAALPGAESRVAASLIGGGAVTQTLMGALHPYSGAQGPSLLAATATPTPTATSTPTETPTPLPPEEIEVKPQPVKLEEGAVVPVSLEIAGRYWPVVPTGLREGGWAYVTEAERVSWLADSRVNVVLGLPYTAENRDLLASTLALSDTVTLRNSVAGAHHYRVVERRTVGIFETEVLTQRRAGLTLVLLGGNEDAPEGEPDRRLVIWAVPVESEKEVMITKD